jgi:hypothetical protein
MADNPISNQISNPGTPSIQPTPSYGPDKPALGSGEETRERPFSLAPEGTVPSEAKPAHPSPMEVAGDASRQQAPLPPEELGGHIVKLQDQLSNLQNNLQNKELSPDHYTALRRVTQKIDPEMQKISQVTDGKFKPPVEKKGQPVLDYLTKWVSQGQETLGGALGYLQNTDKPDIANYLRLQYAVQRASQRGELFASIVGSSVSGVKTIMSTQLG